MNDGSHTGNVALTDLAAALGIPPVALKVALEEAFDIMKQNGNPGLSLHIALARLGYNVNSQALYECLRNFRSVIGGAFNNSQATVRAPQYPAIQMRPGPYHTQTMAPPRIAFPAPQYTSDARTWHFGIYDSQGPERVSRPRPTPSQYIPEPANPQPTPSYQNIGPNT